jgi:hypothetical protein
MKQANRLSWKNADNVVGPLGFGNIVRDFQGPPCLARLALAPPVLAAPPASACFRGHPWPLILASRSAHAPEAESVISAAIRPPLARLPRPSLAAPPRSSLGGSLASNPSWLVDNEKGQPIVVERC